MVLKERPLEHSPSRLVDRAALLPSAVQPELEEPYVPFFKRGFDLVIGLTLLIVTLPVTLLAAVAIKLDSRGPVIFRQQRVGRGGREFTCYKFRSMCANAEQLKPALAGLNEVDGPLFKMRSDPRITRIGRILRRWSIDELPQLINVVKGDMSLVGPRPALPEEVAQYSDYERCRLQIVPGMTGLQQISGRSELSFGHWIELDLVYMCDRNPLKDVLILLQTIPIVLSGRGAY